MENDAAQWALTPEEASQVAQGHRKMAALPHSQPIDCVNCTKTDKKPDEPPAKDTR